MSPKPSRSSTDTPTKRRKSPVAWVRGLPPVAWVRGLPPVAWGRVIVTAGSGGILGVIVAIIAADGTKILKIGAAGFVALVSLIAVFLFADGPKATKDERKAENRGLVLAAFALAMSVYQLLDAIDLP